MESTFVQQAIPMVEVSQDTGKYVLTNQAIKFFKAIKGPIAVVSVAGLYRTGKSYLLNRVLLSRSNGFGVGPTVNPCTKGLWCWGSPIKGVSAEGEPVNIIVIDTQGIGALDEDQTHDTKIFTLAILASSCFIYNSVGSIDENAIQNLSLVVNLTKHIQLKSEGMDEDGVDPDEISNYFPSFYWVVRDFSLQLQDTEGKPISSREYLEKALAPQAGYTDDIEEKNRIRRLLTAFFKDRDCFTMIRPLVDEQKLQNLDKMPYDDLRPEFVHQVMNFRKRVTESVKIKTLQNQRLNGDMYCTMISSYVNAINEGAVPNIENAWNYMCEEQCQRALDDCYEIFIKEMKDGFRDFPKPEECFNKCINEAQQKAIEMFKERALGDNSAEVLKQLKKRIKQQTDQIRSQNIKESNEQIRNYIMKQITPIKMKLNAHQYKGYSEFDKQVAALFDRVMNDGPKLHGYKLIYMEAFKKFSTQGAQFLFRDFTKQQDKQKQRARQMEAKLQTSLQEATQQIEKLENEKRQLDATSYQTIHQLENKVDTLKTQLELMTRDKEEQEKKMERQFTIKMKSQQSERKDKQAKITQYMEKLQSVTRKFNQAQKSWEKDRAIFELKNQQQLKDLEQFNKKEKKWEAEQQMQVNEMSSKNKDMAQRYQREREQMKLNLKDMEQKYNTTHDELSTLKEQLEQKINKWEKKEKKLKDDLANLKKDHENMKNVHEQQKMNLREEIDSIKNESSKGSSTLQMKLKETERLHKQLAEKSKKERYMLQTENEKLDQALRHIKQSNEKLQQRIQFLLRQQERERLDLERQLCQRGQEAIAQRLEEMAQRNNIDMSSLKQKYQNEKKQMATALDSLKNTNAQYQNQLRLMRLEQTKMKAEHKNAIEIIQMQLDRQKESNKAIESQKEKEKLNIQTDLRNMITQLENEIQQIKDKAQRERNEKQKQTEQNITQMRNLLAEEKETLEKRQKKQVTRLKNKAEEELDELNKRFEEERDALQDEIQDLEDKLFNCEEMLKNQSSSLQHDIDIRDKKIVQLTSMVTELKTYIENKQKDLKKREEEMAIAFKTQKEKLESRIDKLTSDNHLFEKDLMAVRQTNEQQKANLEKRQNKIVELQNAILVQKQQLTLQLEKLYSKITEMENQYHEKTKNYEKENALLKQNNDFKDKNISDLEKTIHNAKQQFEDKMNKYKQEKQLQNNDIIKKLKEEKNGIDSKYQKIKTVFTEKEEKMKNALIQLQSSKEAQQQKITNLEKRYSQLEEKNKKQTTLLQSELSQYKEKLSNLTQTSSKEKQEHESMIQKLSSQLIESSMDYQKKISLLDQKIEFIEKSKDERIKQQQERIQKLEIHSQNLIENKNNQKSKYDKNYSESIKIVEEKHTKAVSVLNEQIRKLQNQKESAVNSLTKQLKDLKEKVQKETIERETLDSSKEVKISEMNENIKKLTEENEELKSNNMKLNSQISKQMSLLKEKNKEKINYLEQKVKDLEGQKGEIFLTMQKQRAKWGVQKENTREQVISLEEKLKKAERDREKYRVDAERFKAERKNNNRTHSYISSIKTTYQKPAQKVQENNKENNQIIN